MSSLGSTRQDLILGPLAVRCATPSPPGAVTKMAGSLDSNQGRRARALARRLVIAADSQAREAYKGGHRPRGMFLTERSV